MIDAASFPYSRASNRLVEKGAETKTWSLCPR